MLQANFESTGTAVAAPPAAKMNVLLSELRAINDEREAIAERDRELSARKEAIHALLIEQHETLGLEKFTGGGMSISFDPYAVRVSVDPEKFEAVKVWLVMQGHSAALHRRITESYVIKMVENGEALPEGMTLTPYVKINARRV